MNYSNRLPRHRRLAADALADAQGTRLRSNFSFSNSLLIRLNKVPRSSSSTCPALIRDLCRTLPLIRNLCRRYLDIVTDER